MNSISVSCRLPQHQTARILINGAPVTEAEVPTGSEVRIRMEQVPVYANDERVGTLWCAYMRSLLEHGRVMYGREIQSPYVAELEATVTVDEPCHLEFALVMDGVHRAFVPVSGQEKLKQLKSRERNRHSLAWFLVMLPILLPILAIVTVGCLTLWNAYLQSGDIPFVMVLLFTGVYVGGAGYVLWQLWRRLRGNTHKYSIGG